MTPVVTFPTFPVFGENGTRIAPGGSTESAKYAEGYIQGEAFPAEHENWLMYQSSSAITAMNRVLTSVETELANLVTGGGGTPNINNSGQVKAAVEYLRDIPVGVLSSLSTTAKNNLVAAVNEVVTSIGALSSLETTVKTSLVLAVNELKEALAQAVTDLTPIGSVVDGSTKAITSGAISNLFNNMYDHNVPRAEPKDITAYYQDGTLWNRIAGTNGYSEFQDIYVGDYFQMNNTICKNGGGGTSTGTSWVTVAGINTKMNVGDTNPISVNHLVMVPGKAGFKYEDDGETAIEQNFGASYMNSSNTTSGAYTGSYMRSTIIGDPSTTASATGTISQQLYNEFGAHLVESREILPTSSSAGNPTGWAWRSVQAVLMTEVEVYGSRVWGQSGWDIGTGNHPLPLFQYMEGAKNNRTRSFWLREVSSHSVSTSFCISTSNGAAIVHDASNVIGVRPRFIIA